MLVISWVLGVGGIFGIVEEEGVSGCSWSGGVVVGELRSGDLLDLDSVWYVEVFIGGI